MYVACRNKIHLAATDPVPEQLGAELAACGIVASAWETAEDRELFQGVVLTRPTDLPDWVEIAALKADRPRLLLAYGADLPHGWADRLAAVWEGKGNWEVLRMMLIAGNERALIGGSPGSFYVELLRRQLAEQGVQSLVCARREVDEVCRQLPRYLTLKEKFFVELGDVCDEQGISLQVVSRAMGLDKRVGQMWLYPARAEQAHISRWMDRETRPFLEKPNVQRVALFGRPSLWEQMPTGWLKGKEVRLYVGQDKPFPNNLSLANGIDCAVFSSIEQALEDADLLVIGEADAVISSLNLDRLRQCMRRSNVVDATASFPLREANLYVTYYRSFGEKTNIWE